MDCEAPAAQRRRKFRRTLILGVCLLFLLLVIAVSLGVGLSRRSPSSSKDRVVGNFENVVITRCESFLDQNGEKSSGNTCEEVWDAFSGAYVGKDPCDVPMEAYDPLINAVTPKDTCNRMLFWSKTKDIVHQFTEARKCLVTLEDTLLGSVMDGLTWCGKKGNKETFTTGCPEWMACERNPVRSFWNRVSAAFAESACGDVTVMLNGSISTPFHPDSIFGSIEVKRFSPPRMKTLNVVLVTKGNDTADCGNESLQDLQDVLNPSLTYTCTEVQRAKILDCISDSARPCGSCW